MNRVPLVIHYHDSERLLASRGYILYESRGEDVAWQRIAPVPRTRWQDRFAVGRVALRLVRGGVRHAVPLPDGSILMVAAARFWRVESGQGVVPAAACVGSHPLVHPAVAPDGSLYYGEYRPNEERSPVHVWRSTDGGRTFDVAWEFGAVRHVHGVFPDPFDVHAIWVTTGDDDAESAVWRTRDRFASLERVVDGGQQVRAVDLLFTTNAVYFGSDTPREQNHLYRLDRAGGTLERQAVVSGSVFWGTTTQDGWRLFSTVVEKSRVNRTRHAEVWAAPPGDDRWRCINRARKDILDGRLFGHGQFRFPAGSGAERVAWTIPYAVRGDLRSVRLDVPALYHGSLR